MRCWRRMCPAWRCATAGLQGRVSLNLTSFSHVCKQNTTDRCTRWSANSFSCTYIITFSICITAVAQAVHATARDYQPFGTYHFVLGESIRSPLHTSAPPIGLGLGSDPAAAAAAAARQGSQGGVGDAAYAAEVRRHLNASGLWKAVYASSGRCEICSSSAFKLP